jgi:hypothetical protein
MRRRILETAASLILALGIVGLVAPPASATLGVLTRRCVPGFPNPGGYKLRICVSIRAGEVNGVLKIRSVCRVTALNFAPTEIQQAFCMLLTSDFQTVSEIDDQQCSDCTSLVVYSPIVRCDPSIGYIVGNDWHVPFPDGDFESGGLYTTTPVFCSGTPI